MENSIILKKVEDWWDSLDGNTQYQLASETDGFDDFEQQFLEDSGLPRLYDEDRGELVLQFWSEMSDEEKVKLYNKCKDLKESNKIIMNFETFIKENYK